MKKSYQVFKWTAEVREKELKRDIEGNAIMINGCAGEI